MTLPRDLVVDALQATAPDGVQVEPYARVLDNVAKRTVMVRVDTVKPRRDVAQAHRTYGCAVLVIAPTTDAGPADDELDALLEDVLEAIELSPDLDWSEAKRATLDDIWPAYEITLTVTTTKEQ